MLVTMGKPYGDYHEWTKHPVVIVTWDVVSVSSSSTVTGRTLNVVTCRHLPGGTYMGESNMPAR